METSSGEEMEDLEKIMALVFVLLRERESWLKTSGGFQMCSY